MKRIPFIFVIAIPLMILALWYMVVMIKLAIVFNKPEEIKEDSISVFSDGQTISTDTIKYYEINGDSIKILKTGMYRIKFVGTGVDNVTVNYYCVDSLQFKQYLKQFK